MKTNNRKTPVLVLIVAFQICLHKQGQSQEGNFVTGYYTDQKGDTIRGYAAIRDGKGRCCFKFKTQIQDKDASSIAFDSCGLIAFKDDIFFSWYGQRSMMHLDGENLSIVNIDSNLVGRIPLRLVYKGRRLSLYHYYDEMDHFFCEEEGAIKELSVAYSYLTDWEKKYHLGNQPSYKIHPVYRFQLIAMLGEDLTRKQRALIDITEYEKRSLVRLFEALNISKKN